MKLERITRSTTSFTKDETEPVILELRDAASYDMGGICVERTSKSSMNLQHRELRLRDANEVRLVYEMIGEWLAAQASAAGESPS